MDCGVGRVQYSLSLEYIDGEMNSVHGGRFKLSRLGPQDEYRCKKDTEYGTFDKIISNCAVRVGITKCCLG